MENKAVYLFEEGNQDMVMLLGNKGAQLAEMTRSGLPVPPGFTITTEVCNEFYKNGEKTPEEVDAAMLEALKKLEEKMRRKFGDADDPLLLSVRSGAYVSMPGMMDTVLNLGLNDDTVQGLIKKTNNERFAYDCYRRFVQMYGNVVMGVDSEKFEEKLDEIKKDAGALVDQELEAEHLKKAVAEFKAIVKSETSKDFPDDAIEQLKLARDAVFKSWNIPRALTYRKLKGYADDAGTAVNVQTMVFGNMGEGCGTGVGFTRNPSTGEKKLYGEYLMDAQGEDVVSGVRTPQPLVKLEEEMPEIYKQLAESVANLEKHYKDIQDFEFTIEKGKLYFLQTRRGKRTAAAAVKIAVDMQKEGVIDEKTAVLRVDPESLDQLLHKSIDPNAELNVIARGLPASPGAATGKIVFTADDAEAKGDAGEDVLLLRPETTPDDIHGIIKSRGVLTTRGGMTSHAAVVARGMGMPCIAGCDALKLDIAKKQVTIGKKTYKEGDLLTIDGATGRVIEGDAPLVEPEIGGDFQTLLGWADKYKKLVVRTNADTPEDSQKSVEFGAEGVGLCRTEHMFMAQDRLPAVQEMIMAETEKERKVALNKLLPMQRGDFVGIFKVMDGKPVNIRLLDPPLHEFLPNLSELLVEVNLMKERGEDGTEDYREKTKVLRKVQELAEMNPMLGHRGVRLGVVFPEVYEMQARAILEAACQLKKEGKNPVAEIEVPLVAHEQELRLMREYVDNTAKKVFEEQGMEVAYKVGTMIELPRACVTADKIAERADFFSFGTNDLTQLTFGFSRDDAEGKFFKDYVEKKILPVSPFIEIDRTGVGELMKICLQKGKSVKPDMEIGICGEQGGDPKSVEFCHQIGLDYVSCSPFRVPIARLAAAQAAIRFE